MDFEYKGGNCVTITTKTGVLVIDGRLSTLGLKDVQPKDAIELATQQGFAGEGGRVTIDMPGEYEVNNVSVSGIAATRMIDADGSLQSTMYRISFPELSIAVIGHVAPSLSDEQLEALGVVDVVIIPVGGNGYTLDSHHAVEIVNKIGPKVIIPTHYADSQVHYEVPQDDLAPFLKEIGIAHESMPKWKVKNGALPEVQTVIELTRTS